MVHHFRIIISLSFCFEATRSFHLPSSSTTHSAFRQKLFVPLLSKHESRFSNNFGGNSHVTRVSELQASISPDEEPPLSENKSEEFDFEILKKQAFAFWEMSLPYFKESKSGRWLFAGMVGLTLLNSGVSVTFSYVLRDFWSALSAKDAELFQSIITKFGAALVIAVPVSTYYRFQREKLAIEWREWMTDRTLQLYYSNRVYYSLERGGEIDNPDQRIAEDVRTFTAFSLSLFITVVTSVIDLVSFSTILYSIQPQLFGAIIGYALFGSISTTALGRKLIGLNFEKLQKEANFRYSLVRIRDNAESIAFYAGEDTEGKEVSKRLRKVIENRKEINVAERNLEYFTTAYSYLIQVLPVSVVAPQYFAGNIALGVVSQSSGAFNHILRDLSVIVNQFESLSEFSAGIDRLNSFMKSMRNVDMGRIEGSPIMNLPNSTLEENQIEIRSSPSSDLIQLTESRPVVGLLEVKNLFLKTPDLRRTLIRDLSFTVKEGENLLIVGNSGTGKSSLLRALAGLWTSGSGSIERLKVEDVYFLPQRPYCSIGTLRDQLLYPNVEEFDTSEYPPGHIFSRTHIIKDSISNEYLLDILKAIDLEDLPLRAGVMDPVKGLDSEMDWSNILSLGEQQRLAFGRLLVNRPKLAILDEATSALDVEAEANMYMLLRKMAESENDITYISVGHRPSLLKYHDVRLRLGVDGKHEIEAVNEALSKSVVAKNM